MDVFRFPAKASCLHRHSKFCTKTWESLTLSHSLISYPFVTLHRRTPDIKNTGLQFVVRSCESHTKSMGSRIRSAHGEHIFALEILIYQLGLLREKILFHLIFWIRHVLNVLHLIYWALRRLLISYPKIWFTSRRRSKDNHEVDWMPLGHYVSSVTSNLGCMSLTMS